MRCLSHGIGGFLYVWIAFESPLVILVRGGLRSSPMNHELANIPPIARGIASSSISQKASLGESSQQPIQVLLLEFLVVALRSWVRVGRSLCME